jgi:hypothetical protein
MPSTYSEPTIQAPAARPVGISRKASCLIYLFCHVACSLVMASMSAHAMSLALARQAVDCASKENVSATARARVLRSCRGHECHRTPPARASRFLNILVNA